MGLKSKFTTFRTRQVSVRFQIMLGFGLIFGLAVVIATIGYRNLRALQKETETTLQQANRVRELSLRIENEFLAARQAEHGFLDEWREIGVDAAIARHAAANADRLSSARIGLAELDVLQRTTNDRSLEALIVGTTGLRPLLDSYEAAFQQMVQSIIEHNQGDGSEARLTDILTRLKAAVEPLPDPELIKLLLQIEASEKAYLVSLGQEHIEHIRLNSDRFTRLVNNSSPEQLAANGNSLEADLLINLIQQYQANFQRLVALETSIAASRSTAQDVAANIGDIIGQISTEGVANLSSARARLESISRRKLTELLLTTISAAAVVATAAYLLGQQITSPLRQLSRAAEQIGQGDLGLHVEIKGAQELVTLATSFNSMVSRLRQVLERLEQRVEDRTRALKASVEVSRSLSTILDEEQLVSQVVEQVQRAFDYYHVHIYLLDHNREFLVMSGGTGEAGLAMLTGGHKIALGKGLVGRAAATRKIVLVPDVTQEAGWLSNRLLPETRSELAVPITIGEKVLGVLDVQHQAIGGLTSEDVQLLQSVASQVAIALRNAGLYQEAQQRAEREAMINAISQKIRSAHNLEQALQVTAHELGNALNARRANVSLGALTANKSNGS